jgi:hypothetical protein
MYTCQELHKYILTIFNLKLPKPFAQFDFKTVVSVKIFGIANQLLLYICSQFFN